MLLISMGLLRLQSVIFCRGNFFFLFKYVYPSSKDFGLPSSKENGLLPNMLIIFLNYSGRVLTCCGYIFKLARLSVVGCVAFIVTAIGVLGQLHCFLGSVYGGVVGIHIVIWF